MSCPIQHVAADRSAVDGHPQTDSRQLQEIPQPPEHYLTGNISDVNPAFLGGSFQRLAKIYGPIYKLNLLNREAVVLSSHELVAEVSDDSKFEKDIKGPQEKVRAFLGDGNVAPKDSKADRLT